MEWQPGPNMTLPVPKEFPEVVVRAAWEEPAAVVLEPTAAAAPATLHKETPEVTSKTSDIITSPAAASDSELKVEQTSAAAAAPSSSLSALETVGRPIEKLTLAKLKELAIAVGAPTDGKKADLVKRLKALQQSMSI